MTQNTSIPAPASLSDEEKILRIKTVVNQAGQDLRQRYPILLRQDAIGASILAFALAGMLGTAWLYVAGHLAWWLTIPLVALFASLTHELEHDLIHWMYFRKRPWAHHLMMGLVWLARPSTVNPWVRRELHFNHHKHSGSAVDTEERAITNGERWGLRRLLMTGDNVLSVLLRLSHLPTWRQRRTMAKRSFAAYFPLGVLHWALWYAFVGYHLISLVGQGLGADIAWSATTQNAMQIVDLLAVVWLAPNVLRTFCLHFVSSNMHYYGDIESGNPLQQTQVLNPWWMLPFQLFCFNFGSTHAIHHFVVKEPFYIRHLTRHAAHAVMRENGVRFNDFGTFGRANRWTLAAA